MILFFQQLFMSYAWSINSTIPQPKTSGVVVEMQFDGNIYFNNRRFFVDDSGIFPDKKRGDGVFSTFIRIQSTSIKEISFYENEKRVLKVEIPAISNTEWYILKIDKEKKFKLYKKFLQTNSNKEFAFLQPDELSIVFYCLILGILIGFYIRRLPRHRYLSTVSTKEIAIPSHVMLRASENCIVHKIRSLTQHSFVVLIGDSFDLYCQREFLGRCFFTTCTDIVDIEKALPNHYILSKPIYVYSNIRCIAGDEHAQGREIVKQILYEYPENIIIFVEEENASHYESILDTKENPQQQ